jgi:hypothetical protein
MSKPRKTVMNTEQVMAALAEMYKGSAWAFLQQVRNGTGYQRNPRTADAVVMSLWPSRGLHLYGFEVKVHRGDWLKELRTPEKADEICTFCDFWYVVVGDEWIVQEGELPPTWGLIVPNGKKLTIKKEAPKLDPKPIDKLLLASILRGCTKGMVPFASIKSEMDAARQAGELEHESKLSGLKYKVEQLQTSITNFEQASGVKIDQWNGTEVGNAVKLILHSNLSTVRYNIDSLAKKCGELSIDLAAVIEELDRAKKEAAAA